MDALTIKQPLSATVRPEIVQGIFSTVMRQLLELSEEQMKKENPDSISQLMQAMAQHYRTAGQKEPLHQLYLFWKEYTLKLLQSSSLVLKLSAWDHVSELIREANVTKPRAKAYRVYNAGSEEVNGLYEIVKEEDGVFWYQKKPTAPTEPLITLFRCKMRTSARHWFLSIVDKLKPGTAEDIDYYTHKSDLEQEGEPQLCGWLKTGNRSVEPAPLLERLGSFLREDEREEDFLVNSLPKWVELNGVLNHVFGISIHREIVARSTKLVKFLAENRALKSSHLDLIWQSVIMSSESEVLEELLSLLAVISQYLSDDLYAYLIDVVQKSCNSEEQGIAQKGLLFLEKCQREYMFRITYLSDKSVWCLLDLIWYVYTSPIFESYKNQTIIEDLLSQALNTKCGMFKARLYIASSLNELVESKNDENTIAKVVHNLYFLMTHRTNLDEILNELTGNNFPEVIIAEIRRFVVKHRDNVNVNYVSDGLFRRLKLIRQYFNLSSTKISLETLRVLSTVLIRPLEVEEFFRFLKSLSVKTVVGEGSCDADLNDEIFRVMICNAEVDWGLAGDVAYDCFQTYFVNALQNNTSSPDLQKLGLNTLWKIALRIQSPSSASNALDLIEKAYGELETSKVSVLDEVFKWLKQVIDLDELESSKDICIERIADFLSLCITRRRGISPIPHSARGVMHRMNITVHFKRVVQYYNYSSAVDRGDKPSEGKLLLDIDPLHTVLHLKRKLAEHLEFPTPRKLSLEFNGRGMLDNSCFLSNFGLYDGCDVNAILLQHNYAPAQLIEDEDDLPCPPDADVAVIIARDKAKFDLLLGALELSLQRCRDSRAAHCLWNLMAMIPTESNLLEAATNCEYDEYATWLQSLSSSVKYTYVLQIIDSALQVAPELATAEAIERSEWLQSALIAMGGFNVILSEFVRPTNGGFVEKYSKYVALHIIRFMLFGTEGTTSGSYVMDQVQQLSSDITQTLLWLACDAAAVENLVAVQNSLLTIIYLLQSSVVVRQLLSSPQTKALLLDVLKSPSQRVREVAVDFAVQVGKSQPVVFGWLVSDLGDDLERACNPELFRAILLLIEDSRANCLHPSDINNLIITVSTKLLFFVKSRNQSIIADQDAVAGYLSLFSSLCRFHFDEVSSSSFGKVMASSIFNDFLFVLSSDNRNCTSICQSLNARHAAYSVLSLCVRASPIWFDQVAKQVEGLCISAIEMLRGLWNCTVGKIFRL